MNPTGLQAASIFGVYLGIVGSRAPQGDEDNEHVLLTVAVVPHLFSSAHPHRLRERAMPTSQTVQIANQIRTMVTSGLLRETQLTRVSTLPSSITRRHAGYPGPCRVQQYSGREGGRKHSRVSVRRRPLDRALVQARAGASVLHLVLETLDREDDERSQQANVRENIPHDHRG